MSEKKANAIPYKLGRYWRVKLNQKSDLANTFTTEWRAKKAAENYNEAIIEGKTKMTANYYKKQGRANAYSKDNS